MLNWAQIETPFKWLNILFKCRNDRIADLKLYKGTSRQRSGKGAIRKRFPLQKPRWEKTKLTIRYLYHETIVSRMGSYFPNRWPLSYLNLTKNMKTYIRRQQHKIFFKHQDIKQKEPPQKYRLTNDTAESYFNI